MTAIFETAADRALKAKHRAMWASGDYPTLADDVIPELGAVLVAASGVGAGDRVLDVAAGAGNAAIRAALAGARVVASDLTPELFPAGRDRAAQLGVELDWEEADAEALPYADGEFDAVLSSVGVMFAPHHQPAADELLRVCRPGGTIALVSWTPQGFIGQMFAVMKRYLPPPAPSVQPPPLWGDEAHVAALFGDRVSSLEARRDQNRVAVFGTPEAFRDYFKQRYGPTIAAYRGLADEPDRAAALDAELVELARANQGPDGALDWEYLLVVARKR